MLLAGPSGHQLVTHARERGVVAAPRDRAVRTRVQVGDPLEHGELVPEGGGVHGRVSCRAPMIVERSMHPGWLSNAYLVADEPGGHGVIIDSGGPPEPLLDAVSRLELTVPYLLLTHHHHDHVAENHVYQEQLGVQILAHPLEAANLLDVDRAIEPGEVLEVGGLHIDGLLTPGHTAGMLSFRANDEA